MSRNYRTEKYRADRPSKTFNDVALKIPKGKEATLRAVAHESQNVYIMRATFDDAELEDTVTFVSQSGGKGGDMVMELERELPYLPSFAIRHKYVPGFVFFSACASGKKKSHFLYFFFFFGSLPLPASVHARLSCTKMLILIFHKSSQ